MFKRVKFLLLGLILGLLVGLWFGVNLGRGDPIYSNPFADRSVTGRAEGALEDASRSLRKAFE